MASPSNAGKGFPGLLWRTPPRSKYSYRIMKPVPKYTESTLLTVSATPNNRKYQDLLLNCAAIVEYYSILREM